MTVAVKWGIRRIFAAMVVITAMATGFACGHSQGNPGPAQKDLSSRPDRVPGEYLVTLVAPAGVSAINDLYGRFGIKGIRDLGGGISLVTITEDPGPEKMEELRGQNASVKAVQPNFVYRIDESGKAK